MSVNSVFQRNSDGGSVPRAIETSKSTTKNDLWQNSCCGLTTTEITRLCLRLLGIGTTGAGISVAVAAASGMITWPLGLLAIPCLLGATGAVWYSFQLNDYENPEELAKFRDDASKMSLDQVMQAHGWSHVLRWGIITAEQFTSKYRQQMRGKNLVQIIDAYENGARHLSQCPYSRFDYQIPTPSEWKGQWRKETAAKAFDEIIQTYPLDKLEKYNLLEVGELQRLKNLKRDYDGIKGNYDTQVAQIEREFQNNTQTYLHSYQTESARETQVYHDHWAVRRLKIFELDYNRERQTVQGTLNSRKNEARNRFNRSVATMTNNGQILYDKLTSRDKILYDQQNQELQISIMQADNESRVQIANIDSRFIEERSRLGAEESRVKGERIRKIDESKGRYDTAVSEHRQHKERRMVPIETAFRSSMSDLNSRYRAYLRTIGIA
jgi:hypothetical protein